MWLWDDTVFATCDNLNLARGPPAEKHKIRNVRQKKTQLAQQVNEENNKPDNEVACNYIPFFTANRSTLFLTILTYIELIFVNFLKRPRKLRIYNYQIDDISQNTSSKSN